MQKTTQKKEHDPVMTGKALTGLALRVAVAGYIIYLAWKILSGMLEGTSPIPVWVAWLICIVLAAVAIGFCVYAWKGYQKARKAAEISSDPQAESIKSDAKTVEQTDNEAAEPEDL